MLSVTASGRLSWGLWAVLAVALAVSQRPVRVARLPLLSMILLWLVLRQLIVVLPTLAWGQWQDVWGFVASSGNLLCWSVAVGAGTWAVVTCAPSPRRVFPVVLCGLLSLNLLAWWLQLHHVWTRWVFYDIEGGLFQSQAQWAAWCVIALPLLWRWGVLWSLPALAGLWVCNSASAWAALAVWVVCRCATKRRAVWAMVAGGVIALLLLARHGVPLATKLALRCHTWTAIFHAVKHELFGLGFGPISYAQVAHFTRWPILPHPGSDQLSILLQGGWFVIPLLAWAGWLVWRTDERNPLAWSLRIAWCLSCWQTSVSLPTVGVLAWMVCLMYLIERHEVST